MPRWIRGSSRVEFFIFLIAWVIFFEWWELDLQLIPSYLLLLWVELLLLPNSAESNHFLLENIPRMNESHDPGRPFKVAITTSSSIATSCCLIWQTLVKYDYMVSAFWIFTFFNCFLKFILWFMFFPSNSLVKESNISFGVFREDTCGIQWSVIESMIFLALTKFFLCKASSLTSHWKWNLSTYVGVQFISFKN